MKTALETRRLVIRNFRKQDWRDLHAYLSVPAIYRYEPGEPVTVDGAKRSAKLRSRTDDFLAVELKTERKLIGHLYFKLTEPEEYRSWELGYIFNPAYHDRGYCTEASLRIVEYGFTELGAHRVIAFCDPRNVASWHVLENIGMKREGCFRKKAFFRKDKNGDPLWHDCYAYGILEGEPVGKRDFRFRSSPASILR
jgi:RimJ/RimL family protein N-acetyltransferase